jgi:hypothetical protein
MKKLIYLLILVMMISGCAYTKISCKKLLYDMHSKNILTDNEYNQTKMEMAPALYELTYGGWTDTLNAYEGDDQVKKSIFTKLVAYIGEYKKNELDGMVNYRKLIQDAYRRNKITKEEYAQEDKVIKGSEYFTKGIDYQNILAYFKSKVEDNNVSKAEKSVYVKIYNFSLEEYKKALVRQRNNSIFWMSLGAGLSAAGNSMSQQNYQPAIQSGYQPIYTPQYNYIASQPAIVGGGSYTANSIGNFDYVSGSNGYSGTGQQIGDFYYYNDNAGGSYTTQSIGNFDYTRGSNGYSGTGQNIGNFYYYNDNTGLYTGQSIGNFDYISGPNGYSGTGQKIGDFYYYNDNE